MSLTQDELTVVIEALREYHLRVAQHDDRCALIQTALLKCAAQLVTTDAQ